MIEDPLLTQATESLRGRRDDRWVAIENRVISAALAATRRSRPIRAQNDEPDLPSSVTGSTFVREQVLIAYVSRAMDGVPGSAVERIVVNSDHDLYTGLTIIVRVQFGQRIISLADELRARAEIALRELLGAVTPPVTVTAMHVHVDDVQLSDPNLS